jgi:hypothetical protein
VSNIPFKLVTDEVKLSKGTDFNDVQTWNIPTNPNALTEEVLN